MIIGVAGDDLATSYALLVFSSYERPPSGGLSVESFHAFVNGPYDGFFLGYAAAGIGKGIE
jgi:hypothetical protein